MTLFQVLIKLEKFRIAFIVSRVMYLQHCQSNEQKSRTLDKSGHVVWPNQLYPRSRCNNTLQFPIHAVNAILANAHIYTWVQTHRTSICCTIAFYDAVRYSKMPPSFHLAHLDGLALQLHFMEPERCILWPEGKSAGGDTAVVFGGSLDLLAHSCDTH